MSARDRTKINEVRESWNDMFSVWSPWYTLAKEDGQLYVSDQWAMVDTSGMGNKPKISINIVKKPIDTIYGHHSQNKTDIKTIPIEGADDAVADIHSQNIKWTLDTRNYDRHLNAAFLDALVYGVGWVHPYIDYEHDIVDGDIRVTREDPFKIMFDPYTANPDMSDCNEIIRRAYITKAAAKQKWEKHASDIEKLKTGSEIQGVMNLRYSKVIARDRINIIERWYRDTEERKFLVDVKNHKVIVFEGDDKEFIQRMGMANIDVAVQKRRVGIIKLSITAEDDILLYDGENPFKLNMFPFIPIFCYFMPSHNDFKWKIQGMIRPVKDPQIEKNKRRSQIMSAILSMPHAGFKVVRGANIDIEQLKEPGIKFVDVDDLEDIQEFASMDLKQPLITLEQMHTQDIRDISINPDLMGMIEGASGSSAPGVTLQLRQRQALTGVQVIFDNLSSAKKQVGLYIVQLTNKHYSKEKLQRIIGENAPFVKEIKAVEEQLKSVAPQLQNLQQEYGQMQQQVLSQPPVDEKEMAEVDRRGNAIEQRLQQVSRQSQTLQGQYQHLQGKIDEFWNVFNNARDSAIYDCKVDEIRESPSYRISIGTQLMDLAHQGYPVPPEVIVEFFDMPERVKEKWMKSLQSGTEGQARARQEQEQKKYSHDMAKEKMKQDSNVYREELRQESETDREEMRVEGNIETALINKLER